MFLRGWKTLPRSGDQKGGGRLGASSRVERDIIADGVFNHWRRRIWHALAFKRDPFLQPILVWTGDEAAGIDAFMAPGESNTESLCRAHRVTDYLSNSEGTSKPEED